MTIKSGIYKITNSVNGKVYIGSSTRLHLRGKEHFRNLVAGTHVNIKLQRAWLKYGEAAFTYEIVELVDVELLLEHEQYWIDTLNCISKGYNLAPTAGNTLGVKLSDATRAAMSLRMTGTKHKPETLEKIRLANMGHPLDPEHQRRMVAASKTPEAIAKAKLSRAGYVASEETRAKMSAARLGKKLPESHREKLRNRIVTEETRMKKSIAATGKTHSPETIQKMKNKIVSDETRRKMSLAAKARCARLDEPPKIDKNIPLPK